jgi:hypothetical protein
MCFLLQLPFCRAWRNYPNPDIDAPLTIDEWKHYKEELRIELDGVLDLQKKIENEDVGSSEQQG